jgi:hypothetical protein
MDLMERLHWIASGGAEIFVYDRTDSSYRRIHCAARESKATGFVRLSRHLGDEVAILALYGDRFDDPENDGNALGNEEIPLVVNVGADRALTRAAAQTVINASEKGPGATLRHLAFLASESGAHATSICRAVDSPATFSESTVPWTF